MHVREGNTPSASGSDLLAWDPGTTSQTRVLEFLGHLVGCLCTTAGWRVSRGQQQGACGYWSGVGLCLRALLWPQSFPWCLWNMPGLLPPQGLCTRCPVPWNSPLWRGPLLDSGCCREARYVCSRGEAANTRPASV